MQHIEILPKAQSELRQAKPDPAFLVSSFLSGRNPQTLRAYKKDLGDFQNFLRAKTPEEAAQHLLSQTQGHANALLLDYKKHLFEERKLTPATTNRRLAAVRSLVKLARMLGLCNFTLDVENLAVENYRDTRGPGREGVSELLDELKHREDKKGLRDRALLRLMFDLALRRREVVGLSLEHLDLKQGVLWVMGKGRSGRQKLTLAPNTKDALKAWVKVRGEEAGPLFISLDPASYGGPLSDSGVYRVVRKLGEKVGLKARPHGLRHAAITEALDLTRGDVRAVQRFSRHKSLQVLCVYDDQRKDLAGEVSKLVAKNIPR